MMGTIDRLVQHLDYDAILDHTNMTPKNADEAFRWYICDQSIHFYFVERKQHAQ